MSFSDEVTSIVQRILADPLSLPPEFLDMIPQYVAQNPVSTKILRAGGTSTQTPGAVTAVTIAHGLGGTPTWFLVQPAGVNSRAQPTVYLSADQTNITLNFSAALTAATVYSWVWAAEILNS